MSQRRLSNRLLLGPRDVPPTCDDFEVVGVFNPGAVRVGDEVVLLARVAERPIERRPGYMSHPRWSPGEGVVVDWLSDDDYEPIDARVVRCRSNGLIRLTFISHLRVVRLSADGLTVREVSKAAFGPGAETEEFGVEDPRITTIAGRHYFTYVAVSCHGPATALASTVDFREFTRHGIIFCPENKDVVLFPEPISGSYAALHRPVCGSPFTRPEMWVARSPDLIHWGGHVPLDISGGEWQSGRVGGGAPPIRVEGGWLELYHGNRQPTRPGEVGAYYGGAVLLDLEDPSKVLRRTAEPIFAPEAAFEKSGFVPNIVFPTGVVQSGEDLLVYYGAADSSVAVVAFSLGELLGAMTPV